MQVTSYRPLWPFDVLRARGEQWVRDLCSALDIPADDDNDIAN